MGDWKSDLERKLQEKREVEARRIAREVEKHNREFEKREQRLAQQRAQEEERKLAEQQRRFKCHICGKPSEGPLECTEDVDEGYNVDKPYGAGTAPTYLDWDLPSDLNRCSVCNKWSCDQHLAWLSEGSICEKDAKDGYLPGQKRGW